MKKKWFKRITAYGVVAAVLLQLLSVSFFAAPTTTDTRVADASTMTDWQNYFGDTVLNTENAGGVWGDKSVFLNADEFNDALENGVADYDIKMTPDGTNFLVALSAIAANKSIVGYSALPTDTMLVLDLSNSMSDTAMTNMIAAANSAIVKLQGLNRDNRVGVVVYSGNRTNYWDDIFGLDESATVLLPIDRYTGANNNTTFLTYSDDRVAVANGVLTLGQGQRNPSQSATGATYIQSGMQLAVNEFKSIDRADTVITSGPQAGTVRMPIMVLMSDGAPTAATTSINNVGDSNRGTGSSGSSNSTLSYLTQLTCAWAKKEMADHYGRSPLFYTLGLNVGNSAAAQAVLNPAAAGATYTNYWNAYQTAAAGNSATLTQGSNNNRFTVPVIKGLEPNYVDRYFPASGDNALNNAFQSIVNQIIIQSKYYPTMVEDGQHHLDGYITFHDELGEYMEVRDIKGLTVNGNYYKGSAIAKAIKDGAFGNIYDGNLANMNTAGVAFLEAVEKRLGCTEAQAGEIVAQALRADANGNKQLYYNSESDFSNYIGWYADANGAFLGFWNGDHAHLDAPANAVYANKSYGFMGTVGSAEEFNETDMLHISVQVRENLSNQHQLVIYKIPAALIPTVNYNIEFEGTNLETGTNFEMSVDGANEALRLIFEVGLRSDINRINVAQKVTNYAHVKNGVYTFYSNSWHEHAHTDSALVDDHDATWLEFEPSYENERYYFTANTPIYQKNPDNTYSLIDYDPATKAGQTFYNRTIRFSTQALGMTAAVKEEHYVPITATALAEAAEAADGTWYIKKGTVHRLLEDSEGHAYRNVKAGENIATAQKEHPTKTLNYSNYPSVLTLSDGSIHCDACLGNNGTFTVTAAQGISLNKEMAVAGLGAEETFLFEIALDGNNLASSYPLYDADGNFLWDEDVIAKTMTIGLRAGETVFIADLPTGTTYSVTEKLPAGSDYIVDAVNTTGQTGTVQANQFGAVRFVNTLATYGNLILHKDVFLPTALGTDAAYNGEFDVRVSFAGNVTSVKVDGVDTTVENNTLDLKIKDDQAIVISDIPNGTSFTVSEPNLPSFWQSDILYVDNNTTISDTAESVVMLENYYEPSRVDGSKLSHTGIKTIDGRVWLAEDLFTFGFQYFDGNQWVTYNGDKTVTGQQTEKTFSFTDALRQFVEDEIHNVGVYQLRVFEHPDGIDGIGYDLYPKHFALTVENDFATGQLKITNVTTLTPPSANGEPGTTIANVNGEWQITTLFENTYAVAGTAELVIDITKEIDDYTGLNHTKAGFNFELYQLDGNGQKINVEALGETDASGKLVYRKSFGADQVGQIFTYYLAEVDEGEDGMQYDAVPREINFTIVDNLDGTVSIDLATSNDNVYDITFTNTYRLDPATLTVQGNKKLTGRDPQNGDLFNFVLSQTDENFENPVIRDSVYGPVGNFVLTDTIVTGGTYYYTVTEGKSYLGGITDDTTVYHLTVQVGKGDGNTLKAVITSVTKANASADSIEFVNVYKATGSTEITFGIDKTMDDTTGLNRGKAGFRFEMYQLDGNNQKFDVVDLGVTDADGELTYTKTWTPDDVGKTFVYYIAEVDEGEEGVGYDLAPRKFVIDIVDNLNGTISAKVGGVPVGWQSANFQNTYRLDPATVTVTGNKTVVGRDPLSTDAFTFELYRTDDQFQNGIFVADTTVANGNFTLTDQLNAAGTYYYTVSEADTGIGGITKDPAVYYVTVVVDKGVGETLKATITSFKKGTTPVTTADFVNNYAPQGETEVTIDITKDLDDYTGLGHTKAGFKFELYQLDGNGQKINVTDLGVTDANGKLTYTKKWTAADVGQTFTYYLAEVDLDEDGMTYDLAPREIKVEIVDNLDGTVSAKVNGNKTNRYAAGFHNIYALDPAILRVEGNKKLTGRDPLSTDVFRFDMYLTDQNFENPVTVSQTSNNGGAFALTHTVPTAGTYYYKVVETASNISGITDDPAIYYLTVVVGKGTGETLEATIVSVKKGDASANTVEFENVYKAAPAELTFKGTKELTGGTLTDNTFTFKLYETDDTYAITGLTALGNKKNVNGAFAFDAIRYTEVGTHYYAIVEDATVDPIDDVVYDGTQYNFRVDVTDAGDGQLKIAVQDVTRNKTAAAAATQTVEVGFVNAVFEEVTGKEVYKKDTTTLINGQEVEGGDLLTYVIFYKNYTGKTVTLEIVDTIPAHTTYVDGSASSGGIFADGKLTWTMEVKAGDEAEVTFDVKVNEEESGSISNTAELRDGVNKYTTNTVENPLADPPVEEPPVDVPATGEGDSLFAWLALAFVSGACLLGTTKRKKQTTK